jgi:hypothetical protein
MRRKIEKWYKPEVVFWLSQAYEAIMKNVLKNSGANFFYMYFWKLYVCTQGFEGKKTFYVACVPKKKSYQ